MLEPLVSWIQKSSHFLLQEIEIIDFLLVGPNLCASQCVSTFDLLCTPQREKPKVQSTSSTSNLKHAYVQLRRGMYHEWLEQNSMKQGSACPKNADLIVCFNAGLWGYDDWTPTIQSLILYKMRSSLIVTSYTIQEA